MNARPSPLEEHAQAELRLAPKQPAAGVAGLDRRGRSGRLPRLLVSINGNAPEWRASLVPSDLAPRLPLPYAFGAALAGYGFPLAALDAVGRTEPADLQPFCRYFPASRHHGASVWADFAIRSGTEAALSSLRESVWPRRDRKTVRLCYGWSAAAGATLERRTLLCLTRRIARLARCVIFMTHEQCVDARAMLPRMPIVSLRVGIDSRFYRLPALDGDVPDAQRPLVKRLLREPYVIMPGDQLRLDGDALAVAAATGLRLVRITQSRRGMHGAHPLASEIARRGLVDRVVLLENISYPFLRFLLRHAAAYAGLVDSTWQPAGWTVACESLASGLPVVLYDGYVARELAHLGAPRRALRVVGHGDQSSFARELMTLAKPPGGAAEVGANSSAAARFLAQTLDIEVTGPRFARDLAAALGGAP